LQFSANATRILERWCIDKSILGDVVEPHNCIMKRWKDGRTLAKLALNSYHRKCYGAPFWDIHRHDLIIALHKRACELGADVRVNSKVVDVEFEQATLTLESGETCTGDLVVGADGLNSMCRQKLVPTEQPEFTGDIAFRVLLNVDDLPVDDLDLQQMASTPQCTYWLGPSGHSIVYILKGGKQINLVAVAPDDLPPGVIRAPCDVGEVLALYKDWDPM
jgi:salicylate hydroxylase